MKKLAVILSLSVFAQAAQAVPIKWEVNGGLGVFPLTGSFFFDGDDNTYSFVDLHTPAGPFSMTSEPAFSYDGGVFFSGRSV